MEANEQVAKVIIPLGFLGRIGNEYMNKKERKIEEKENTYCL